MNATGSMEKGDHRTVSGVRCAKERICSTSRVDVDVLYVAVIHLSAKGQKEHTPLTADILLLFWLPSQLATS